MKRPPNLVKIGRAAEARARAWDVVFAALDRWAADGLSSADPVFSALAPFWARVGLAEVDRAAVERELRRTVLPSLRKRGPEARRRTHAWLRKHRPAQPGPD